MSARETVARCWGDNAPDWVLALADEVDRSSQSAAGARIGYTKGTICQVLRNQRRPGSLGRIAAAVQERIMVALVGCPVLGEITVKQCSEEQARPYSSANPLRVRLYRTCRECEHNRNNQEAVNG